MSARSITPFILAVSIFLLCGCPEVRTVSHQVEYLKKPLKPLPDVKTYSVEVTPAHLSHGNGLRIEGKQLVAAKGDIAIKMTVGSPMVTNTSIGRDLYTKYLTDEKGRYVNDSQGNPIIVKQVPVYWVDVTVKTASRFEILRADGQLIESSEIPLESSFVVGKKPQKLLGGAVTLWTGGDWVTDRDWLETKWRIEGPSMIAAQGNNLQAASLMHVANRLEHDYSEGMRKEHLSFAMHIDGKNVEPRLEKGILAVTQEPPQSQGKAVQAWQELLDDKSTDQDGAPVISALMKACANLNVANLAYIKADWPAANLALNAASYQSRAYEEGFFEGLFKGNKAKIDGYIGQLSRKVSDRAQRDRANAITTSMGAK
jgi:hypothetical protein